MHRKIIIGYNDSDGSRDALALGKLLAEGTCADLILTCVFPDDPFPTFGNAEVSEADTAIALTVQAAADDIGAEAKAFPSGSPAQGLHDAAEELGADLVVVGSSTRRGVDRFLAGNVALRLLHGLPSAVAVAPPGFRSQKPALKTIGIGFDGSAEAKETLAVASELAAVAGATLRLLASPSVVETGEAVWGHRIYSRKNEMRESFQASLCEAVEALPSELRPIGKLLDGGPAAALTSEGESGLDLLCVGSHGYGPLGRAMLGSVSTALVKAAPCPPAHHSP